MSGMSDLELEEWSKHGMSKAIAQIRRAAAEEMRERAAKALADVNEDSLADYIRALPIEE